MISIIKKVILVLVLSSLTACIENNFNQQNTLVPEVNVNTTVSLDFISFPSTFTIKQGQGYQGIIVFNIDGTNFRAFDLGCPYTSPSECSIPMQVDEVTGEMSCIGCSSDDITFTQYQNGVTIGESDYFLREYYAFQEGGVIRITNY